MQHLSVERVLFHQSPANTLTELDLGYNDISLNSEEEASSLRIYIDGDTVCSQEGIQALAQAIKSNQRVQILSLAHNYIKVRDAARRSATSISRDCTRS